MRTETRQNILLGRDYTVFICENCGHEYKSYADGDFKKCNCCKMESCSHCRKENEKGENK